ncbi:hypothetical protein [Cellvibrio sp. PSBB006]|uniref:hypothetical protein n=1 Tax=Cellvibrio sp. PSBB006 TaxID=1987723 RepID=UPI000B3B5B15|nr:hypothetical protein [Cellvibrio sp. PSBB006]ARU29526.1 hypothetical protein CBR65_19945 [Cellvibrio sp. PSBB006]
MKLLTKVHDLDEAQSIKYRLEFRGIPIFIGSENSGPAIGAMPAADCYTIWAEVDEQYQCALIALSNEDYEPAAPINIGEFRSAQDHAVSEVRNTFSKINQYILNVVMLGVIGWFIYYAVSRI